MADDPFAVDELERELAALLLDNADAIVDRILDRIYETQPMLHDLPDDVQTEVRDWIARLAHLGLRLIAKGESLDGIGPLLEQNARRRRAQRIDPEMSLRGHEAAQQVLFDEFAALVRGRPDEAALFGIFTRRQLEFQRVIALRVAVGFQAASNDHDRDRDQQSLLELLVGRRAADDADPSLAARLGVILPLRMATVSVALGGAAPDVVRLVRRQNPWAVTGTLDDRVVLLSQREPRDVPPAHGSCELGDDTDPRAVAAAVARAGRAADVADRLGAGGLPIAAAAPLAALLAVPETERQAYLRSCFGELPDSPRGEPLLASVAALLTLQRAADAARALHVHRHTLDYRLRRFTEETGLDLTDPASRFRAEVGLFLLGRLPFRA